MENNKSIIQQRMEKIFNEWAARCIKNPEEFGQILDSDGELVLDYGQNCYHYFVKIADEMDADGRLPRNLN